MAVQIKGESVVSAVRDQVSGDLGGEAVILHVGKGVYFGLNEVGARIWNLIQQPRRVEEIQETLLDEYKVDPARCETDLFRLLRRLAKEGLIEVQ
jgi:hypothetical protein